MYRMTALVGVALCLGLLPMAAPALGAGDYIVVLKDGFSPTRAARRHGAVPTFVYHYALLGYAATLSDRALARAQADPSVDYVVPDQPVWALGTRADPAVAYVVPDKNLQASYVPAPLPPVSSIVPQEVPVGIQMIGGLKSKTAKIDGRDSRVDVDVAIIDTGVQTSHPDLNVVGGVDCSGGQIGDGDPNGHGTNVAGIVGELDNGFGLVGVAPGARIWSVRVLDKNGSGATSKVICGVEWVTAHASTIEVANMSLIGVGEDDGNCGRTKKDPYHSAICASVAAGVTYVAGAGNQSADAAGFVPAAYDEVITVSALTETDGRLGGGGPDPVCFGGNGEVDGTFASFSNFGHDIDLAAPGVCVRATLNGSLYQYATGTSQASPHVAGAAALYKATHPNASPADVRAALVEAATPGPVPGDPDSFPEGVVNVRNF